jgi:SAM-dependent methyltransferase
MSEYEHEIKSLYAANYQPVNTYYVNNGNGLQRDSYSDFLSDFHLLDAGCGTGLYTKAMYDLGIGNITGLEFNAGMLSKCANKLQLENARKSDQEKALQQRLRLFEGDIIEMPFKSASFDAIMINFVLHHIDDESTRKQDLLNVKKALHRCSDVVNEDGMLFITTTTPIQFEKAFWYYPFFKQSLPAMIEKFRSEEWWMKHILEAGFSKVEIKKICEPNMYFDDYYNFRGPSDPEWRNGDSFFALVSEDELQHGLNEIQRQILDNGREGERQLFYEHCETQRLEHGHAIAVIAHK